MIASNLPAEKMELASMGVNSRNRFGKTRGGINADIAITHTLLLLCVARKITERGRSRRPFTHARGLRGGSSGGFNEEGLVEGVSKLFDAVALGGISTDAPGHT